MPDNRNKKPEIDPEGILDETPPNINEPQTPPEEVETPAEEETPSEPEDSSVDATPTEEAEASEEHPEEAEGTPEPSEVVEEVETEDDREKRYKSQQAETQIQAAKSKNLLTKIDEAAEIKPPTEEEMRVFVAQDGADWDELTPFEQSQAKRTYLSEKRFDLINAAAQDTKNIEQWAHSVDDFIDKTDGDPKYLKLSGHEAEFRAFAMKESHRGVDIEDLLLPAFLGSLTTTKKARPALFPRGGGGGENTNAKPGEITDADDAARLRVTNPKEYKRKLKAGLIKVTI